MAARDTSKRRESTTTIITKKKPQKNRKNENEKKIHNPEKEKMYEENVRRKERKPQKTMRERTRVKFTSR